MRKEHRVKSFDGTQIAYFTHSEGERTIVLCNGVVCVDSYWKYLVKHLAPDYRVITWDYRGHGASDPPMDEDEITIRSHARDLQAILDAENIKEQVVGGFSMGVQVAVEFYRIHPESCRGLLLVGGPPGKPLDAFYVKDLSAKAFPFIYRLGLPLSPHLQKPWGALFRSPLIYPLSILVLAITTAASREDMQAYYDHVSQFNVGLFLRMIKAMGEHDGWDVLPNIKVPALVIAGTHDRFTIYSAQEEMQRRIPGSEFLKVPLGTHPILVEQPDLINLRVGKFLEARVWPRQDCT
ncbi:MAG: alpha/beta hydrolase [bacterium]|nr:alpha/beta hydrolase [bacterium]